MRHGKSMPPRPRRLRDQLLHECRAMAHYALESGFTVPADLMQSLDNAQASLEAIEASPAAAPSDQSASASDSIAGKLATVHNRLVAIVAPATPRMLLLLERESKRTGFYRFLGPVRLARQMTAVAVVCLIALIWLGLSPEISSGSINNSLFDSSGKPLLLNLLFVLFAAGIGGSFAALFQAQRYIGNGTFDPKYESSYWVRFVLGLIAGMILSEFVPINVDDSAVSGLGRPLLAMLGGFSAAAVHRLLSRLVDAVDSVVRGDIRERLAFQEQATSARYAERSVKFRSSLASRLTRLQQQIGAATDPDALKEEIDKIQLSLFSTEGEHGVSGPRGGSR